MNKIKIPSGSLIKTEQAFEDLQTTIQNNTGLRHTNLFQSYGTLADYNSYTSTILTSGLYIANTTNLYFNLYPGYALLPDNEIIYISGQSPISINITDSVYPSKTALEDDATYIIGLKYNSAGSSPIQVMSAFVYSQLGGDNMNYKYSIYSDSFTIYTFNTANYSPYTLPSGVVPLGIIKHSSGQLTEGWSYSLNNTTWTPVNKIIDCRRFYNLKLNKYLLSDSDVVLKDRDSIGVNKVNGTLQATALKATTGYYDDMYPITSDNIYVHGTIKALDFVYASGYYDVMSDTLINLDPTGLIQAHSLENTEKSLLASGILCQDHRLGAFSNLLDVKVQLGYDFITGTAAANSNVFTLTKPFNVDTNSLAGYWLYIPNKGSAVITSNTSGANNAMVVVTVTPPTGTTYFFTVETTITDNQNAWIHSNADEYRITAIPMTNTDNALTTFKDISYASIEKTVRGTLNNPAPISIWMQLEPATAYRFEAYGLKNGKKTTVKKYPANGASPNYYLVRHGEIAVGEGNVSLLSTEYGFAVSIPSTLWPAAKQFEIAYSKINNPPTFNDSNGTNMRILTSARIYDIITSSSAMHYVNVRPLAAGQQVGTALSGQVKSGGGGNLPGDQVIISSYINHKTYSGTIDITSGGVLFGQITLNAILSPAGNEAMKTGMVNESLIGSIITIESKDFLITEVYSSNYIVLKGLHDATLTSGQGKTFLINCLGAVGYLQEPRVIIKCPGMPINYEITRISYDCDSIAGGDVYIRVYQEDNSSLYGMSGKLDTTSINTANTIPISNVIIQQEKNLVVDLYNPSLASNVAQNSCFAGQITVYGKPYFVNKNG